MQPLRLTSGVVAPILALSLAACGPSDAAQGGDEAATPELPDGWPAEPFPVVDAEPEAQVALGRLLFYDPIGSTDGQTACATCHSEVWGMSDGLPRSVGVGGGALSGPGRQGANLTRRNSPALWNVRFERALFWDGRATSLEDQVHFPFDAAEELGRPLPEVVRDVAAIDEYVALFEAAFPDEPTPVTEDTFARAIAAFERTLISRRGLYDAYVAGDARALDEASRRGMYLFADVGCVSCHPPPLFTTGGFADRGVPDLPGIPDRGRAEHTGEEADAGLFKIPGLRNLRETGPYFHTGAVASLEEAVAREAERSAASDGQRVLTEDEKGALAAFLRKALFDRQSNPTRPKDVPSGLPVPRDGFDLLR